MEGLQANAINKAYDGERYVHIFSRPEKLELLEYNLREIKCRYRKPRSYYYYIFGLVVTGGELLRGRSFMKN